MKAKMTKLEALRVITRECHADKNSANALKRLRKAMDTLGLTLKEKQEFEITMEYRRSSGDLRPLFAFMEYPELRQTEQQ